MTTPAGDRRTIVSHRAALARFLEEPGGHVLLDTEYRVIDCGPEFLRLTKAKRDNVTGKYVFDTLTDPDPARQSHAVGLFRAALQRAGDTLEVEKIPDFRLDVHEQAPGARVEERWWRVAVVPMHRDQKVDFFVMRVEDMTLPIITNNKLNAIRKSNYILYLMVCVLLGLFIYVSTNTTHTIRKNTKNVAAATADSCVIQRQFLPAQHQLAHVMFDINRLLLAPQSKTQPRPTPQVLQIVAQMEVHLNQYLQITKSLPQTRVC